MWMLPLINSLCNPIIYACLDQTYREAFKHLFQKMMCRTRSNTQQPPAVIELREPLNESTLIFTLKDFNLNYDLYIMSKTSSDSLKPSDYMTCTQLCKYIAK